MKKLPLKLLLGVITLFGVVILDGCNCNPCPLGTQVTLPASDATGPDFAGILASFQNETQPHISVSNTIAAQTTTVLTTDVINILASGGDPEGAKAIKIWVEETGFRNPGQQIGPGLLAAPEAEMVITGNPGDKVCTPLRKSFDLKVADHMRNYDRVRLRVFAETVNFNNQSTFSNSITFSTQ
ncbi:MAG TPA: hypothetical protein PKN75_13010 [Bacteroidia bacterium]|nr:hypothetical protein [Bacteroidia bacterium]HNU34500.1 hypothetical protein [Bacteroidia bacterium]